MGNNSKTNAILLIVAGVLAIIGLRVFFGDKSDDSQVGVRLPNHKPVVMRKNTSAGLHTATSGVPATRNESGLTIWGQGESNGLVILERAHPVYAQRVELNRNVLARLKVGDEFSMRIPQTSRILLATVIEWVHNQHSETLLARVSMLDRIYAIQITISAESVFGNIETPEGVFVLEQQANVLEGSAVIFSEKEIYQNLDYRESDAIPLDR